MAEYRSSGKELRRSAKGAYAAVLGVLIFCGVGAGALKIAEKMQPIVVTEESSPADISVPDITDTTDAKPHTIFKYETVFASSVHTGPLILVNSKNALLEDPSDGLVPVFSSKNDYLHVSYTSVQLQKEAMDALNDMATGFYKAKNNSGLLVDTGFRTMAYQKELYDADLERTGQTTSTRVAAPGCSDYQSGYALSFRVYLDGAYSDYSGEGDFAWIGAHSAEYGFVTRFTKDKVEKTGFPSDPSHFRYVGVPHAMYMKSHNLCLEEYMDLLSSFTYEGTHLEMPGKDGKTVEVFSILLTDAINESVVEIPVPAEFPYTISGNNRGAFIVTVFTDRPYGEDSETTAVTETTAPQPVQ